MAEAAIRVENLSKRYRIGEGRAGRTLREALTGAFRAPFRRAGRSRQETIWALKDVSFAVAPGEVVGVIGRNGAGKSTLLKVLSRITEPTTGRVEIRGRVGSLLEVGTGFHAELTGRENIYLNGAILGMKRAEIASRFDEIVAFAEVDKFIDTPVKHYSSGMYLRLAFAVAAHLEPEILLVDEVLAVGDVSFQKKCLGKIQQGSRVEGRTAFFVSHQMNVIGVLCTRVLLIHDGRLTMDAAEPKAAIAEYLRTALGQDRRAWENTGRQYEEFNFVPERFYLADARGRCLEGPVGNDETAYVHIEGRVKKLEPQLFIGYALFDENGTLMYMASHNDDCPPHLTVLPLGRLSLRSRIPPHMLNEGSYRVQFTCGEHWRDWYISPEADGPTLALEIVGGLSGSQHWQKRRRGMLGVVTTWEETGHDV